MRCLDWYSWVDSNHRPPDPQSGALNQLSYSCTALRISHFSGSCSGARNLGVRLRFGKIAIRSFRVSGNPEKPRILRDTPGLPAFAGTIGLQPKSKKARAVPGLPLAT